MSANTFFAVALVAAVNATRIVYRDDIPIEEYRPPREDFPFSFNWPMEDPGCGATMVSPWHFVTAAHCLTDDEWKPLNIKLKDKVYKVIEQRPNSCYDVKTGLPNPADVAIMVLEEPIVDAVVGDDYLEVWSADMMNDTMEGKVFTLIGWG